MGKPRGLLDALLPAGLGTLLAPLGGAAMADVPAWQPADRGSVVLRYEGADIYMAERGGPFVKLDLGDTAEARTLLLILRQAGPEGAALSVPTDRRIVADGGASVRKATPRKNGGSGSSR